MSGHGHGVDLGEWKWNVPRANAATHVRSKGSIAMNVMEQMWLGR